ncbi:N-acetyl-gamma-glutamyl-phosphate reductase [Roseibacillus ishigakijimensis]|uniref:N-acetyl-gamma-glutamyl-phosphate reductase n=1 Tax=Roseibacillus ishigakijimensis TaxID=454146 RepID=A0A934RTL7_9BACT|nr:N-acetyl-gamma-glutamyl-phosphate reductase [Roseibacillus ishigakijimensis]MBK1834276.1 N-acetyl-gamma-glutamyl-phosphate reductase [Roseibacillus ishigakijimensis]
MEKIKTAVLGASGYTGIELLRLLLAHPAVELTAITSRSNAGQPLSSVLPRFTGLPGADLPFIEPDMDAVVASGAQTAFLALPHGKAADYALPLLEKGLRVIDLSADFRLNELSVYEEFYGPHPAPQLLPKAVYGMPELYREEIKAAQLVASPGCYPTSIILPLVPLLRAGLIAPDSIVVSSLSGVSGAGRKAALPLIFAEVNESLRAYGLPKHRHLSEIEQELSLAAGERVTITFTPHLVPVTRGIHSTITATLRADFSELSAVYESAYGEEAFVRLLGEGGAADTAHVTRTNFVDFGWHHDARTNRVVVTSAEDNLTKGASGQALQAFNLLHGLPATAGLLNL